MNETLTWTQGTGSNAGSGTLTIVNGAQTASLTLAGTYAASDFALKQDNGAGTDVVFKNFSWGQLQYPAAMSGEHLFGVSPQLDLLVGVVAVAYTDTSDYATGDTSYAATRNVELLDPFFLPGVHAAQTLPTLADTVQAPARNYLILPNISFSGTVAPEGIYVFKGQVNADGSFNTNGTGGGNAIWGSHRHSGFKRRWRRHRRAPQRKSAMHRLPGRPSSP